MDRLKMNRFWLEKNESLWWVKKWIKIGLIKKKKRGKYMYLYIKFV